MGLVNTAMTKVRYEIMMGNVARAHFHETVFCSILRSPTIQKELGFDGVQSIAQM